MEKPVEPLYPDLPIGDGWRLWRPMPRPNPTLTLRSKWPVTHRYARHASKVLDGKRRAAAERATGTRLLTRLDATVLDEDLVP